jgi:hypothetical protein
VKQFIEKLGTKINNKANGDITFEEFLSALQKWNKKTTTSPNGRHLGHYILLTKLNVLDDTDKNINKSTKILELIYSILMTCIPERWKHVTTCMIEKIPNVSRNDKLRVIHIYEADYNLLLGKESNLEIL